MITARRCEREEGVERKAETAPTPPAPAPAAILSLQRGVGNHAVARLVGGDKEPESRGGITAGIDDIIADAKLALELAATGLGLAEVRIGQPVGRGGKNEQRDVASVCARLLGVGFSPGANLGELGDTIARYQSEVLGMKSPDGRIDPGGRTLGALQASKRAPEAAEAAQPAAPDVPVAAAEQEVKQVEEIAAGSSEAGAATAAEDLARLQQAFKTMKRSSRNEESGKDRDKLVGDFEKLRDKVAKLDPSLRPAYYRAMNAISPFYYQGLNIILEFDRVTTTPEGEKKIKHVFNTCNITSLAMCLEALGMTSDNYKYKTLLPAIAEVYTKDVNERADDRVKGYKDPLAGLRLPDYIAMAAIVWQMGYKTGDKDQILAGGNLAFNEVPSAKAIIQLAKDFGATPKHGTFKLDRAAKKDPGMAALKKYGAAHSKQGDERAQARTTLADVDRQLAGDLTAAKRTKLEKEKQKLEGKLDGAALSDAAIERDLPVESYRDAVLRDLAPELDGGRQVVVGQHNHFVRLQSVDEEFVVKDDPGGFTRGNMQATWEEARAMGLFWQWISIG